MKCSTRIDKIPPNIGTMPPVVTVCKGLFPDGDILLILGETSPMTVETPP